MQEVEIPSCYFEAKIVEDRIVAEAVACGFDDDALFAVRLSVEEALANAIRHGNREDKDKKVRIRYSVTPVEVEVFIADEGPGFVPKNVPDPTLDENLEKPNGRGIMLMNAYMNCVEYNAGGNEVHLVKRKDKESA